MPTRIHTTGLLVLAIVFAATLLPASALAQAGLTGDATGSSADQFDKGFQSKSALGQLEELTGTTVDRSSSQSSNQSTVTRVAPQPRPVQPHYDPNQQIAGAAAATIIGALFANVFSDNSAQEQAAAEAAAAQAAAEAEAFRVQQEAARKARIQMAQHYRADWDSREAEIGDRLGGAFDVTTGTALFGRPANPDADTVAAILSQDIGGAEQTPGEIPDVYSSDPSVVDLRGSSLVVQPLRPLTPAGSGTTITRPPVPATTRWAYDMQETDEPPSPSQLQGLAAHFGPWLGKWYWETVALGAGEATDWGLVKKVPGQMYAKALFEFTGQRNDLTKELGESYARIMKLVFGSAEKEVYILVNPNSRGGDFTDSSSDSLGQLSRTETVKYEEMAYGRVTSQVNAPDVGELRYVGSNGGEETLGEFWLRIHP